MTQEQIRIPRQRACACCLGIRRRIGLERRGIHKVASWEGFVLENLRAAAPAHTTASFYRTAAGAEIDLVLETPGHGLWAIEIKRTLSPKAGKGFYIACEDLKPSRRFVVYSGFARYSISTEVEAIGLKDMAALLATL